MTPLPPPAPTDEPVTTPPTRSRRRLAIAAVAATALGLGGVAAGSQLAGADDERDPAPADDTVDGQPVDDDTADEPDDDDQADDAGVDEAEDDEHDGVSDEDEGVWDMPELDDLKSAFEEFENCLSEQLPDLEDGGWLDFDGGELPEDGNWDDAFDDLLGGSVTVFSPGADGGDLTLLDLGEGDGTVTITQTGGEITVVTEGDVQSVDAKLPAMPDFDLPDIGFEPDPDVDAAFESCASLLPADGIFDMVGEFVGDFVHDGATGDE
jgi:hypothetical protein